MKMHRLKRLSFIAALSTAFTGCGFEAATEEDLAMNAQPHAPAYDDDAEVSAAEPKQVASIDYTDGRSIVFYEPEPGFVVVSERGPIGSMPLYDSSVREQIGYVATYEQLAGAPAPAALVEAESRNIEARAKLSHREREPISNETLAPPLASDMGMSAAVAVSSQALSNGLTTERFRTTFCWNVGEGDEYFHWLNVTGTGSITRSDIYWMRSAVMGLQGTVRWVAKYRTWYTWHNLKNLDVPAGWYDNLDQGAGDFDFDGRSTVSEADGDIYNMCTQMS